MISFRAFVLVVSLLFVSSGAYADSTVYQIGVDGMACPFCVYGVEKQLRKVDGVTEVETELKTGTILLTVTEGEPLTRKQYVKLLRMLVLPCGLSHYMTVRR